MLMTTSATITRDIRIYADFISDGAARSLRLLREIDNTVAVMRTIASLGNSFCATVKDLTDDFSCVEGTFPEDELASAYESVQASLAEIHRELVKMHAAAAKDHDLRPHDGVCEAVQAAIRAIINLHDAIETFRWRLLEHNADQEDPAGPVLTSAEEIEQYLAAL